MGRRLVRLVVLAGIALYPTVVAGQGKAVKKVGSLDLALSWIPMSVETVIICDGPIRPGVAASSQTPSVEQFLSMFVTDPRTLDELGLLTPLTAFDARRIVTLARQYSMGESGRLSKYEGCQILQFQPEIATESRKSLQAKLDQLETVRWNIGKTTVVKCECELAVSPYRDRIYLAWIHENALLLSSDLNIMADVIRLSEGEPEDESNSQIGELHKARKELANKIRKEFAKGYHATGATSFAIRRFVPNGDDITSPLCDKLRVAHETGQSSSYYDPDVVLAYVVFPEKRAPEFFYYSMDTAIREHAIAFWNFTKNDGTAIPEEDIRLSSGIEAKITFPEIKGADAITFGMQLRAKFGFLVVP